MTFPALAHRSHVRADRTTTLPGRRRPAGRLPAALLTAGLAAALLVPGAPSAQAHDVLVGSTPEDGATLDEPPAEIVLTYNNEPLDQNPVIELTDDSGAPVPVDGEPEVAGHDVSLALPELEAGSYEASWSVVSSDGHRIEDVLSFTVEAGPEEAPEPADDPAEGTPGTEDTRTAEEAPEPEEEAGLPGELASEEEPSRWWLVALALAGAGAVAAVVVRLRRQGRDQDETER